MTSQGKRIGLFLARPDETQRLWAAEARAAAEQHGADLTEYWADDSASQAHQIGECIWKDLADALVILPASQSGPATLLIQALDRGKAVVLVNETRNDLSPEVAWSFPRLKESHPSLLVARVAPDEAEVGRVQGRQARALLPRGGQVLYVQGATMSAAALARTAGFEEVLAASSSYRVGKIDGGWTSARAEAAVYDWLRLMLASPDYRLDLVSSQSDVMLPGVRGALARLAGEAKRPDLTRVLLTGCDGLSEIRRAIAEGTVTATIEVPSRTRPAVELCIEFWRTGKVPGSFDVRIQPLSVPKIEDLARQAR